MDEEKGKPPWSAWLDITDGDRVRWVADDAVGALGRVDVAVSNAGYGLSGAAGEATGGQAERQVRTNLTGPADRARVLLALLRARGQGRVVEISSVGTVEPRSARYPGGAWRRGRPDTGRAQASPGAGPDGGGG